MGLFKKESHTHFVRDESGNVVKVQRSGDEPKKGWFNRGSTPISDRMEQEYYKQHPEERKPSMREKFASASRRIDSGIKEYNRKSNPMRGNYNPFGNSFDRGMSRRSARGYSVHNNYNPFGSMFDSGVKYKPARKKKPGNKYVVVGGKAYPVAGSKKKSKKKTTSKSYGGYDMTDNWGFMK